ncbi:F-box/LRR-repeat protein 14-like isoform X13 [Periplaneta americana]|uniref:F-box/LRR-repeat protein 14-like isoform X13 n=1 Tax=Periplaneta americana TaxID=6978 RepID=UPI0037E74B4C
MSGSFVVHCDTTLLNEMATGKHIEDLPDELLIKIFSYINMEDLAMSVQHVNAHWKHVSQDNSLWKDKVFSPDIDMNDDEIARRLENMPALKAFCPKRGLNINLIVNVLCQSCKDIQYLQFTYQRLYSITLKEILETLPNIVNLNISLPQETHYQLEFGKLLGQCQSLTTLSLRCHFTDTVAEGSLMAIADGCPSLQNLDLGSCVFPEREIRYLLRNRGHQLLFLALKCFISNSGHELLCKCTNLKYLDYYSCNVGLPRTYMDHLGRLSKLEQLTLSSFREKQSKNIPNIFRNQSLSNLVKLSILYCDGFGAAELTGIFTNCLQIQFFHIRGYCDSDDGFMYIGNLKQLELLDIAFSESLSDKSVEYICSGCESLKHLNISFCSGLTDKSVAYISVGCPRLKYLAISHCLVMTDAMIQSVVECKELTVLDMKWNYNILGSYFHLISSNLINLKELHLHGCEKLNPKNVSKLQEEMRELKINV